MFNDITTHLVRRFRKLLYWDDRRLSLEKIKEYAKAIKGVVDADRVWGFIDGTMRPFCRPGENQQKYYSGHKKQHDFQYQLVTTPDG